MSEHIVIIGNGIAGITAARHIRKHSDKTITVISSESKYFYSRTALMYIYMGHMKQEHTQPYEKGFWSKNKIDLEFEEVVGLNTTLKNVELSSGKILAYDQLIIATGSIPNSLNISGADLKGVQSLYSLQDLELMEANTKGIRRGVVIGGGLIGVEMAEMLRSRNIEVTLLVRENNFWDVVLPEKEAQLLNRHILEHQVDLRLNTELSSINGNEEGKVVSVTTTSGDEIETDFVGITVGVSPNSLLAKQAGIEVRRGILVNSKLQTSVTDVYAIGDCAELQDPLSHRRPIEAVWYSGRMMGETVARTICGKPTDYLPGYWFNSAKFFDIEYQTYGKVGNKLEEGEGEFYWEHDSGRKCLHFVYKKSTRQFIGVNAFGIRLRHEIFDKWLTDECSIDEVIERLSEANFDPEFYTRFEKQIQQKFKEENPQLI